MKKLIFLLLTVALLSCQDDVKYGRSFYPAFSSNHQWNANMKKIKSEIADSSVGYFDTLSPESLACDSNEFIDADTTNTFNSWEMIIDINVIFS